MVLPFEFFLLSIAETKWSDISSAHVLELLNKSYWFASIKSMHVGFVDWKHAGKEVRLFRLNDSVFTCLSY